MLPLPPMTGPKTSLPASPWAASTQPEDPMAWSFPVFNSGNQPISFSYPNTPITAGNGSAYVAPPYQQPLSDMDTAPSDPNMNNLGFATLDDWFGTNTSSGAVDGDAIFGGLDLQDFWMKVGPGEVSYLLTWLICRHKEASPSADTCYFFLGLSPKILVPTRTLLLPSFTACTKSALIPMLNSRSASWNSFPFSRKIRTSCFRVSFRQVKSGLSFVGSCDASHDPIVMRPRSFSPGQESSTCMARSMMSPSEDSAVIGLRPDLESSPDVLTWR
jgi:hypothetical protein